MRFSRPFSFCILLLLFCSALSAQQEVIPLWQGLAPGETKVEADVPFPPGGGPCEVTSPRLVVFTPKEKKSDTCILVIPGGGYFACLYEYEGTPVAQWWADHGITAAYLIYRVPRPASGPIYLPAWQDAQRAIRVLRANAERLGIDPEKIGAQGFSAGSHLTVMAACASQTPAYEPQDEIDNLPCHLRFAMPVYLAYALSDGATDINVNDGKDAKLLIEDFRFDEKTPPMCLIHGDSDPVSPMNSLQVYQLLHQMKIPCELHIYQGAAHGFVTWKNLPAASKWLDRCYDWLESIQLN